jgi:hypothetical protein
MRKKAIAIVFIFILLAVLASRANAINIGDGGGSPNPINPKASCGLLPGILADQISNNEPWYCPINQQMYAQWSGELPLAFGALLAAFAIATIITMFGIALKSDRMRNFGIGELYEAIASTIIVGMFLYMGAVMFGIIPSLYVGNINPFPTALNLMTSTIQQTETLYSNYLSQYMPAKFDYSVIPSFTYTSTTLANNEETGAELTAPFILPLEVLYIAPLLTLGWILSDGATVLWAEYYMLVFFSAAAIPVFLIPGIILRSLFPTRALGGMLMALAIGFYMVMPTLFAVAYYFTAPGTLQMQQTASAQSTRFAAAGVSFASITPTSQVVMQLQGVLQNAESAMSGFWLLILFYPVLIITLTYAFVTQVAQFIGGAARTGGRLRGFI